MNLTTDWTVNGRPNLLLVDDDAGLCESLAIGLGERGYQVQIARTARDATQAIADNRPRYAVIALKLPDASGLQLISTLKGGDPAPRIVILTAYPSIRTAVEAIKLGAVDYLAKPATVDDIIAALHHDIGNDTVPIGKKAMSVHRATWEYISHVLHQNNGNISATARSLSIDRRTLLRKLRKRPGCP